MAWGHPMHCIMDTIQYVFILYILCTCVIYLSLKTEDHSYKLEGTEALIIFSAKLFFLYSAEKHFILT